MPKISDLTAATSIGATDVIPIVQSGTTKKLTATVLTGYVTTAAETSAGVTPADLSYAPGDVRRYTTIQDAFTAAQYGQHVHFPNIGANYTASSITVYGNTYVTADAGVIIEKSSGDANSHIFDCIGTLSGATALTASTAKRDVTVAVTSASGYAVGDVVCIRDNSYKWSTNGRNLEFNEIAGISGTTITLKQRLIGAYTTGNSAEMLKVSKSKIVFENIHCLIPSGQDGGAFYVQDMAFVQLNNCGSKGQKGQAGVQTWRAGFVEVNGGEYSDGQSQSTGGYGYGISFAQSSHNCVARGVVTRNVRENAISLGSRFCKFIDCEAHSTYDNSFNAHADGSEDCEFINCRSYFARSKGFVAGGTASQAPDKRIRFIGCESHYSGYMGFWADGASGVESEDIVFESCKVFHWGDDTGTSYGIYAFRSKRPRIIDCWLDANSETNARAAIKVEICTDAIVKGNTVRGVSSGWGIIHANCTGVQIDDNSVADTGASGAIHAESTASTKVYVRRNKADNNVALTKNAGDIHLDNEWDTKRQRATGATSVADGGTITHGLLTTPTSVRVTGSVSGEFVSVTALSSTTFTVAIKTHANGAGTTQTVYWEAVL